MQDKLLDLDHVVNFRDFGGYDAAGGARVARGQLYRSASFHEASPRDVERLNALNIRFLVDLRRPEERRLEPNRWPGDVAQTIFNDEGAHVELPPHLVLLLNEGLTAASVRAYMTDIYRGFAFDARHIELYSAWFRELAQGGPGVIHCAAGKDRTGLGCALTLLTLGVGEDDVYADYEFTNVAVDLGKRLPRIKARMESRLNRKIEDEVLRPMLGVEVDYLRAALESIEAKHGSVRAYVRDVLNVDDDGVANLRAKFLA